MMDMSVLSETMVLALIGDMRIIFLVFSRECMVLMSSQGLAWVCPSSTG